MPYKFIYISRRIYFMGLLGRYMMINAQTLEELVTLENDDLIEKIEELNQDMENQEYDIDKLWDGLHFLLTGVSASQPIEGNRLSEAIVGVNVLNSDDENVDFVAYTKFEDLSEIITSLKSIDISKLKKLFDLSTFRKARIYPDIWRDTDKEELFDELVHEYKNLLNFYEKAFNKKVHVIVSIY